MYDTQGMKGKSLATAIEDFIDVIRLSRSENTARSYANGLTAFRESLNDHGLDPEEIPASKVSETWVGWFAAYLKDYSPATEQLYIMAVTRFYQYLVAEELAPINLQRVQMIVQARSRRPGQRLPQFPREEIRKVLDYATNLPEMPFENENDRLRNLRDAAFIVCLADTGMRVHEICKLRRGDIDWNEYKALIIGKGDQQAIIRFSSRAMRLLRGYLSQRAELDGISGRPLPSLPLFARHDKGAGKKIKPMSTATGRNIIKQRVKEALGDEASGAITPHSFRHYFVTNVLRGSGGNLKLAQELARHKNIQVTQRYAHLSSDEIDEQYYEIFERENIDRE
ncbi:MAG: tyrosine-type recombinase/integrase [Anaerolineales bacterium]|jgi:site-specific recombinase XerD